MTNITNYLNKVKTAVYGKDVRGAIHDAIKQVYDDASVNHDNANMEVKLARGTHNTLNDRLDNVDEIQAQTNAQLSQKFDKTGIVTMANMGQDVKEAMTGGSVAVVGVNSVDTLNLHNNAVEPRNIKGHSIINLLNADEIEVGKITASGVVDRSQTAYRVSPFIQVKNGDTISFVGRCQNWNTQVVLFDLNKSVVGYKDFVDTNGTSETWGTLSPLKIIEPECCYIRFNFSKDVDNPYCYLSPILPENFIPYNEASISWLKVKKDNLSLSNNAIDLSKLNLEHSNQLYLTDSIKFNRSTSHLYIPDVLYRVNNKWRTVKATDFPEQHPTGEFRFWANDLSTLYFDSVEAEKGNYPFVWKTLGEKLQQDGDRYQTVATIKTSGILTNYSVEYLESTNGFDVTKSRLMIPNKLFMIEGDDLILYKHSILTDIEEARKVTMEFKSDKSYSDGCYEYIEPKLTVKPDRVGINAFIGVIPDDLNWTTGVYGKEVSIVKKSTTDVSNKNPNILFFGDSLTQKGTPTKTKDYLSSWGVNANLLGTVRDDYNGNCEGRGGRTFAQYIGYRSVETTDDSTETPIYPFLKLANEADKQNHPTWCFTRTNSIREQNYNEATDKQQDFYIFDFNHYLTSQGYSNPDVVIISMSTNDFWKYDESEAIKICKLAYDIMIHQILEVSPNCKIGIIPHPAYANTRGDKDIVGRWNGVAQEYVYSMNNPNVDVIGAWMSQSSDMSFNLSKVNKVSDGGIYNYQQQDTVHPTPWGIKECSKVIGYYIINQL